VIIKDQANSQDWAIIITTAIDAFRSHAVTALLEAYDSRGISSNLADIYINQLAKWHEDSAQSLDKGKSGSNATAPDVTRKQSSVSQLAVYEKYGRLVIQSLSLQHAMEGAPSQVAPVFALVSWHMITGTRSFVG
jgi:hypothetical protein